MSSITAATPPSHHANTGSPEEFVARSEADPAFHVLKARFREAGVLTWITDREMALHFGIAASAGGHGTVVELGTFEGGAAVFLAGGIGRRGAGRVSCIDPHFGGPPWLGTGPAQRTHERFLRNTRFCDVSGWIDPWVGDSAAVAAVWPADPVDVVFIDGDHSYLGALRDFECWAPKVRPGGWVLIDDVDDIGLPELLELVAEIKTFSGVTFAGQIDGVAAFRRTLGPPAALLDEVRAMCEKRGLVRPWSMAPLHRLATPPAYGRSWSAGEPGANDAYMLAFLVRCGPGAYGFTANAGADGAALVRAVATDRREPPAVELTPDRPAPCRVVFCDVAEVATYAPYLVPGGLLLTLNTGPAVQEQVLGVRNRMLEAGLEGCGSGGRYHWGIWQPFDLSSEAVVKNTTKAYQAG